MAIIVGLFFAGVAYLQYQQIISVSWDKVQTKSQGAIATLANAATQIGHTIGNATGTTAHVAHSFETGLGIPLIGSIGVGLTIGFLKG